MPFLGRKTTAKRLQWALLVGIFMAAAPQLHSAGITPGTYAVTGEGNGFPDRCGQDRGDFLLCEGPIPFVLWALEGTIQWDGGPVEGPWPGSLDGTSLFGHATYIPPNFMRPVSDIRVPNPGFGGQLVNVDVDPDGTLAGFSWIEDGMFSVFVHVAFDTPQSGTWTLGGTDWDPGTASGALELARIPEPGTLCLLGAMRRCRP